MTPRPEAEPRLPPPGGGRLEGRIAVVTGGDSGIGRAVTALFAREGADVAILYLDEHDDARETAEMVTRRRPPPPARPGDLGDEDHCRRSSTRKRWSTWARTCPSGAGQPDEVAPAYAFLASEEEAFITGQGIHPNGGTVVNG
jgi:NAD(P)-dependent dehydrogenase (short-subunit alcohol dehydrogenase family)